MVAPGAKKPKSSRPGQQEALRARHEALALVEEQFRDFDVVWAKVHGFPWWPGVLFHSWDVVRRAGIRTDPKLAASLAVPPPEKVPVLDAFSGQDTGAFRLRRHCLVMFVDKFNFSLVEIDAGHVASYTAHYQAYAHAVMGSKSSKWSKKKAEFRRALVKAAQLLHMGKEYVEDDLVLLKEPSPAEKKQRMDEVKAFEGEERAAVAGAVWGNRETRADDVAVKAGALAAAGEKKPAVKAQKKASSKKSAVRNDRAAEGKDGDGQDDDVVPLTPEKPRRKAPAKVSKARARKPSRKEVESTHVAVVSRSPSPIDLTNSPESEKTRPQKEKAAGKGSGKPPRPKKKKANGDAGAKESKSKNNGRAKTVLVLEDDNDVSDELQVSEQVPDEVTDITQEGEPNSLTLTPLSSIWTTGVPDDPSVGSGVHTQLAYKQDFVWDDNVFTDELSIAEKEMAAIERKQAEEAAVAGHVRERSLGKRQSRSVQQSHIRQNLMAGNLDPHTMVQCTAYRPKDYVDDPNSRSRGGPTLDPPFQVVVHPDAVFVADLHAHLATCEIIGFLGGKWDEVSKTLYIQAAFPCRSLVIDGDDGSTDVEMDPGSEIELRGIIENAQLEVVGWYHSHPAFAPDPSVRDIENQTSYQQLFQRPNASNEVGGESKPSEPFVGLIVGTYDTRRSTPVSLFRYFHTRGEKVSGGARREIYMPYEFIPGRRHFRSVMQDEERERTRLFPMYHSVLEHFKLELASIKQQLPTDTKAPPAQRAASRSSPARINAQGPVRKRKQSSDGAGDKPVKKAKAKSRRSTRSSSATESRIDLTGDDDGHKLPVSDNEVALEISQNGSADATMKDEASVSNGVAIKGEKVVAIVESSGSSGDNGSSAGASAEKVKPDIPNVEPRVAEIIADVVVITEAANDSWNARKRSRKAQNRKRINEGSISADEGKELPTHDANPAHDQKVATVSEKMTQHAGGHSSDASSGFVVKTDVDATGTPINSSSPRSLPALAASAVKAGVPTSNGVFGRKRNRRKPQKTIKNSNRSTSPPSDGLSPGRSPSPTKRPAQTYFDAFQAKGPCFPSGATHEEATSPSTRSGGPKPDNNLVDDVQYIEIDKNMGMTATNHADDNSAENKDGKTITIAKTPKRDDLVSQEVRNFVSSLVEQVVEKMTSDISASASSAMANRSSNSATDKVPVNESESLKTKPDVDDIDRERNDTSPQLFGSNTECEDIQTSLQKMAGHLKILKSSQAPKSNEAVAKPQAGATPETESKPVVVKPESKQDDFHGGQDYLTALRTKYGPGVNGCAEQVITLVDYYRDFERRTDLSEIWKLRITKLEKIESSLSEYVQFLNIPAVLRHDFIKDLISYLRESWATTDWRS
ncbi:hypothetical protein PHYPSEUDO_005406 [Phytophthora pseudosyringae]|uniref:Myb-like, SWIRM and MPN domain-containing protein 1 n=1 Tax=Phytophthora pseudosyringae TaxID=221518 RepID=A0A8T1VL52_9STRA|nr:hypothetical protein PHYPSEUDO_005406 [Phytophthora pseudosyringae]